jgi:hypothetical protein
MKHPHVEPPADFTYWRSGVGRGKLQEAKRVRETYIMGMTRDEAYVLLNVEDLTFLAVLYKGKKLKQKPPHSTVSVPLLLPPETNLEEEVLSIWRDDFNRSKGEDRRVSLVPGIIGTIQLYPQVITHCGSNVNFRTIQGFLIEVVNEVRYLDYTIASSPIVE